MLWIKQEFQRERKERTSSLASDIREGVLWVLHKPVILFLSLMGFVGNALDNGQWILFVVLATMLRAPAALIGLVFALGGLGGIAGASLAEVLTTERIAARFPILRIVQVMQWATVPLLLLYLVVPNILALGVLIFVLLVVSTLQGILAYIYRLSLIPDEFMGRVGSVSRLISYAGPPVGLFVTGLLLQWVQVRGTVLVFVAVSLIIALLTFVIIPHPTEKHGASLHQQGEQEST